MTPDKLWKSLDTLKDDLTALEPKAQGKNFDVLKAALGEIEATKLDHLAAALDSMGNSAEAAKARATANILHLRFDAETEGIE